MSRPAVKPQINTSPTTTTRSILTVEIHVVDSRNQRLVFDVRTDDSCQYPSRFAKAKKLAIQTTLDDLRSFAILSPYLGNPLIPSQANLLGL